MAERMDADAPRYQRTTIYGTIDGGSSLQTSDCQEGPRGAIQRDLTISMTTVHAIIADFSEENRNIPIGRCLRERSPTAFLISRRAAGERLVFFGFDCAPIASLVPICHLLLPRVDLYSQSNHRRKVNPGTFHYNRARLRITLYNYDINYNHISCRL